MKTKNAIADKSITEILDDKKLESAVNREIDRLLNLYGIYHWSNNSGAVKKGKSKRPIKFGKPGSSDWLGICPDGRFLAIESKRPVGGVTSDLQKQFLDRINSDGGVGIVARSAVECYEKLKEAGVIK